MTTNYGVPPATAPRASTGGSTTVAGAAAPITLAVGEQLRYQVEFSPHLILSHLKVSLLVTNRRLIVQSPHTLFGIIQHGYSEQSSPLGSTSEILAGDMVSTKKVVVGAGSALVGLYSLVMFGGFGVLIGLVLLGAAVFQFLTARQMGVFIRNHGAGVLAAPAGRRERALVDQAKDALAHMLFGTPTGQ